MQNASAAFGAAAATHRTWMPPLLHTDWDGTGYAGAGTVDDLSRQMANTWEVAHTLDDGYPQTVAFVSGMAVPELKTDLAGRVVNGAPMHAAAYWSPLRTDSPIYGYDRDVPPVTLDAGLVTDSGPEYVRVFSGQMVNTPVKGGKASLQAISGTRLKLMKAVLPPAFPAKWAGGVRASWLVSWALYACGLYAGPQIRTGSTTLYHPMHGSCMRFLDAGFPDGNNPTATTSWDVIEQRTNSFTYSFLDEVNWIPGPYVAAPDLCCKVGISRRVTRTNLEFDTSDGQADVLSQASSKGRLELWIKGVPTAANAAPAPTASRLFNLNIQQTGGQSVSLGLTTDRQIYCVVLDGVGGYSHVGATLPSDNGWHFVGIAYDLAAGKFWSNLDGTVSSSTAAMVTTSLPARDTFNSSSSYILSYVPFSDMTFSTGLPGNVDNYPVWRNDATFAPTARVGLSQNRLVAVAETAPREAWELIGTYAQAELAMMRCDELDVFNFLPLGWWVKSAQQQVVGTIDTARNAKAFDIDLDPTKIRNAVTLSYPLSSVPQYSAALGVYRRAYALPTGVDVVITPGTHTVTLAMQTPLTLLYPNISVYDGVTATLVQPDDAYVTLNSKPDGKGTYATGTDITISFLSWNAASVTLQFVNMSGITWYAANDQNVPALSLLGLSLTQTQTYVSDVDMSASSQRRGQRLLSVSSTAIQSQESARRLARNLKMFLRRPVATIGDDSTGITVNGDPRRQPGDLVQIRDTETGVTDSQWRLQAVRHKGQGASYTQEVVARHVMPVCIVGQGIVGQSLVGPAS